MYVWEHKKDLGRDLRGGGGNLLALKNDPTLQSYCGDSLLVDVGLGFDHLRRKRLTGTRE